MKKYLFCLIVIAAGLSFFLLLKTKGVKKSETVSLNTAFSNDSLSNHIPSQQVINLIEDL